MTQPQNTLASPVFIKITASTDNCNDQGYNHCFEQKSDSTLTFDVYTDPSVDNIYFVLWNIHDPVSDPHVAEPPRDWPVKNGHVKITIGPDHPLHLGPGPYCATLTASSSNTASATSSKKIGRNCKYKK